MTLRSTSAGLSPHPDTVLLADRGYQGSSIGINAAAPPHKSGDGSC
jgi:hypothetical protein